MQGKGVSFMEHPRALADGGGTYHWHAGAPNDEDFARAHVELVGRVDARLARLGLDALELVPVPPPEDAPQVSLAGEPESGAGARRVRPKVNGDYVAQAYGDALLELAETHPDLVVLDGDLASDCRVRAFEVAHPARFVENGIAEQDMVSMAGGLARQGLLPVVNSFASFLASRANEQIYNNASEGSKVIYALHYAGLIPAGPGKSHQSVRDISLLGALPNMTIVQPGTLLETRAVVDWAVSTAVENVAIRLAIGPMPRQIELPPGWSLERGRGTVLHDGADALLFAYGPVMLHEALTAAETLASSGATLRVVDLPWLTTFDLEWLGGEVASFKDLFVLEDHSSVGGLGDALVRELSKERLLDGRTLTVLGVEGWPACGTPPEVLSFHRLDGVSIADRVAAAVAAVG